MSLSILYPQAFEIMPAAVLFDTDNTLYDADHAHEYATKAAEKKACKLLGVDAGSFKEAFNEARQRVKRQLGATASSHSRLLYFQTAIEILGMRTQLLMTLDIEQTYWRTFLEAAKLFPDVREFILDLRGGGIKTAVITDLTAQIQFRKLIYFGLDEAFDYVVTSEEAGADKPAEAPFRIALGKLQVAPERCWMIGDNPEADIRGGRSFNICTLHKRHGTIKRDNTADASFEDFGDLRRFIIQRGWISQTFNLLNA